MGQEIAVGLIVLGAAGWLVWHLVMRAKSGGCSSCASAGSCPFEGRTSCSLSDQVEAETEESEQDDD